MTREVMSPRHVLGRQRSLLQVNPRNSHVQNLDTVATSGGPQECGYKRLGGYWYTPVGVSGSY